MNLFYLISAALIVLVLILLVRYAWGIFFDKSYRPVEWEHAVKSGSIRKELESLERNYPDKVRFFNWWFQVERLKRDGVPGDFAELGVYKGESAKILHMMDPSRTFHLYDTFEGFKEEDLVNETGEAATYTTRNFADTSLEAVKRYLGEEGAFVYHAGRFVQLSNCPTAQLQFALVNLDADLYNPTKAGLEYFYPRLSPGGVIFIHDYTHKWPGIKRATDEFISKIPETLVHVPDMDGTVMIVKISSPALQ
ncbi:MAG: TylF/MycF/NovP-related O-methyltransferase [Bacteroidales bacterium]|nr:TylF/MycF/NovP-related O-methyltransferase [Bacteroidales bacterium]